MCTGPSCTARGARPCFDGAWRDLEAQRLAYYTRGGSIRLTESGCLGACHFGPTVAAYVRRSDGALETAWYHGMDRERVSELCRAIHDERALPDAGRYDDSTG